MAVDAKAIAAEMIAAAKAKNVKLFTGHDDGDLPDHVKAMPANVRRRWVDTHNYHAAQYHDNTEAQASADQNTYMSAAEIQQMMKTKARPITKPKTPDDTAADDEEDAADGSDDEEAEGEKPKKKPATIKKESPTITFMDTLKNVVKSVKALVGGDGKATQSVFIVQKSNDKPWRVFMVYSNPFKDHAKEIISEAAHKEYVNYIDNHPEHHGEFHLYHTGPESRWGKADFVDYVDGCSVVSGLVDKGMEPVVTRLEEQALKGQLRVSHGFYGVKSADGVYMLYRPFEFSPLPKGKEANSWTGWLDVSNTKELELPFSEAKKKFLKDIAGLDDTRIAEMEGSFKAMTDGLKEAGVEWKEAGDVATGAAGTAGAAASAGTTPVEPLQVLLAEQQAMSKAITDLAGIMQKSLVATKEAVDGFQTELKKSRDDIVADALTPKVGATGGFVASESKSNNGAGDPTKEAVAKQLKEAGEKDWFAAGPMGIFSDMGIGVGK